MEANNGHYAAGYHHNHAALVNLALTGNGGPAMSGGPARHHMSPSVRHSQQLPDPYNPRSSLYSMGPGPGQNTQTPQMHPAQLHHNPQQQHSMDHGYGAHPILQGHSHANQSSPAFQNTYSPQLAGFNNVGLASGVNDPYQRTVFPYPM